MSSIPKDALNQHIAILGKTGSGKTYAAKGFVEAFLLAGRQVCIIDPTGAWWGLRLAADGKGKGLEVILIGGEHADLPLAAKSGAAVARLVTKQRASVVIDTSGLMVGERTNWFIDFAETLYATIESPLHLVIDEAHSFMPKGKVPDPAAGKMLHVGNQLMAGGRSRGVRGLLITQRPQKLHNDSLTCAETLVAMRLIAPPDRKAVKEWIDGCGDPSEGNRVLDSLAKMPKGSGWVWYPEGDYLELVKFPTITTYDSSATPKYGAKAAPKVGEINLAEVREALADAVKEAEANDPKLLRRRIAELEAAAKKSAKEHATAKPVEVIRAIEKPVPVLKDGQLARVEKLVESFQVINEKMATAWDAFLDKFSESLRPIRDSLIAVGTTAHSPAVRPGPAPRPAPAARNPDPVMRTSSGNPLANRQRDRAMQPTDLANNGDIGKGERIVLTAIAQHDAGVTREQLTVLTGYKATSRNTYIQRLSSKWLVAGAGNDRIVATEAGIAALGPDYEPLPTGQDLRNYWLARLSGGERTFLELLIRHYPNALDREALDEPTGYKATSRNTYLQRLAARELIESVDRSKVKASDRLF